MSSGEEPHVQNFIGPSTFDQLKVGSLIKDMDVPRAGSEDSTIQAIQHVTNLFYGQQFCF